MPKSRRISIVYCIEINIQRRYKLINSKTTYNFRCWAKVDTLNRNDRVSVVIQIANEFLQQPKTANAALQTTAGTLGTFLLVSFQSKIRKGICNNYRNPFKPTPLHTYLAYK